MAKGNQKYERQGIEKEQAKYGSEYDSFMKQFLGRSEAPQQAATPKGIGGLAAKMRGDAGVTGQAVPRQEGLSDSSRYKDILAAGQEERGYLSSGLRGLAETGGLDPGATDDYRARYQAALGGGPAQAELSDFTEERGRYRDFADTGGYTAPDISRIRAQSARSAPALYDALKSQNQLAQSRMGANAGAGAGFDFKNARAAAQQSGQDKLAANIGLAESQRAGKQFGIQGLESTGTTMGAQRLQNAGLANQYNLGAADITASAEGRIAELAQKGKIAGYGGLQDLYGQAYAPEDQFNKTWLDAIGASSSSAAKNRGLQLQNDEVNRSRLAENIIGGIGAAAGGITGMGGISAIGKMFGGGGQAGGQGITGAQAGQGFEAALGQNAWGSTNPLIGQATQPRNSRLTNNYFGANTFR